MKPLKIGYLGPEGTFTEEALLSQQDYSENDLIWLPTISETINALANREIHLAFVPLENSIEGSVMETLDQIISVPDILIQREVVHDVHLYLLAKKKIDLSEIKKVVSYPHAWAQCRSWLKNNLAFVETVPANSTAEAAKFVTQSEPNVAAIAPKINAKLYDLKVLANDIEDFKGNQTRFVALSLHKIPKPTGHDKTSVVCFQGKDRPGSLHAILGEFAARNINLTKLESRPTKQGLGHYCFVIDLEGHISEPIVADCLKTLKAELADVKFLGSYSVANKHGRILGRRNLELWNEADSWVKGLQRLIESS